MTDKIKIKVSSFVANILENDAIRFGFLKNGNSNKNALLNKLIPTLVEVRKARRSEIEKILSEEYNRADSETIYEAANTVIDRVYFNDGDLKSLDEYIWIRPSKTTSVYFDEIQMSETKITAQETPVYIRGLLNEYCRLPQYKREELTFDKELDIFYQASIAQRIIHFKDKKTDERIKAFPFQYYYGFLFDQVNYCVIYDIDNKKIKAVPAYRIQDIYMLKQKYLPSEELVEQLLEFGLNSKFNEEISVEEE